MVALVVEDMVEMSSELPVQQRSLVVVVLVAVAPWVAVPITASAAEKMAIGPVPAQWTEEWAAVSQEWVPRMQLKRQRNVTTVRNQVTGLVSAQNRANEAQVVEEVAAAVTAVVAVVTAAGTTVVDSETIIKMQKQQKALWE